METVTLYVDEETLQVMAELVRIRKFPNRSELIRSAIRELLFEHMGRLMDPSEVERLPILAKTLDQYFSQK
ncbi:MAG: ribbon-helix-helix domain-containing protein [Candidatus Thorarchaeota archaeon]